MSEENYSVEVLSQDTSDFELNFKLIIIGDQNVGKSCLTLRATKNSFEVLYSPTIGFEFMTFFVKIDGKTIKLQIWDTCGQEVYRSLISSFYNNSSLAVIVYAIDNEDSFNNLEFWLNELKTKGNPDINLFLIGNKADLEDKRKISKEQGQDFCDTNNMKLFMESSAKTGFNAQELFVEAAKVLYDDYMKYKRKQKKQSNEKIKLENEDNKKQGKGGCCSK